LIRRQESWVGMERTPSPPSVFGRQTCSQDTRHLAPLTLSVAAQRKARRSLSRAASTPGGELERTHGEGGQGIQDNVEKNELPTCRHEKSPPTGEILVHFGDQWVKRSQAKLLSRQRQPKVSLGKPLDATAEGFLDATESRRVDMHRDQDALPVVDSQASRALV
jgi:hypothetical protein